ncbi:hypothetical protein BGW42_002760 [Actinomortierella wolfii]|nr:hypothetical protein BGW42_002760 [Actinomortierella wolfii]
MDSFLKLKVCINPVRVKGLAPGSSASSIETKDGKIWKCDWKFVAFVPATTTVGQLREEVLKQYKNTYPNESSKLIVEKIRTDDHFDLATNVNVQQAFGSDGVAFVVAKKTGANDNTHKHSNSISSSKSSQPQPRSQPQPKPQLPSPKDSVPALKRKRDVDEESESSDVTAPSSANIATSTSASNAVSGVALSKNQKRKKKLLAKQQKLESSLQSTTIAVNPSGPDTPKSLPLLDSVSQMAREEALAIEKARNEMARREAQRQIDLAKMSSPMQQEKGAQSIPNKKQEKNDKKIETDASLSKKAEAGVEASTKTNALNMTVMGEEGKEEAALKDQTTEEEEFARRKAAEDAALKKAEKEAEAKRMAEEQAAAKRKSEEAAAKKKAQEEPAARRKAEELERKKAQEEEIARKKAEEQESKKAEEEAAASKKLQDDQDVVMTTADEVQSQHKENVEKESSTASSQTPKRKPGRPPKAKSDEDTSVTQSPAAPASPSQRTQPQTSSSPAEIDQAQESLETPTEEPEVAGPVKRKVGRPPKVKPTENNASTSASDTGAVDDQAPSKSATTPTKRTRQRAKAAEKATEETTAEGEAPPAKRRGRKASTAPTTVTAEEAAKPKESPAEDETVAAAGSADGLSDHRQGLVAVESEVKQSDASNTSSLTPDSTVPTPAEMENATAVVTDTPAKRKPGRPPRAKPTSATEVTQEGEKNEAPAEQLPSSQESTVSPSQEPKRRQSRQSKAKATAEASATDASSGAADTPTQIKRKPGRPPKAKPVEEQQPTSVQPASPAKPLLETEAVSKPEQPNQVDEKDTVMAPEPSLEEVSSVTEPPQQPEPVPSVTTQTQEEMVAPKSAEKKQESPKKGKANAQESSAVDKKKEEEEDSDDDGFDASLFSSLRKSQMASSGSSGNTTPTSTALKPKLLSYMLDMPHHPLSPTESPTMRPMSLSVLHQQQQQSQQHASSSMDIDMPARHHGSERSTPMLAALAMGVLSDSENDANSSHDEEAVVQSRARGSRGISVSGPPTIASSALARRATFTSSSAPTIAQRNRMDSVGLAITGLEKDSSVAAKGKLHLETTKSMVDTAMESDSDTSSSSPSSSSESESEGGDESDGDSDTSTSSSSTASSSVASQTSIASPASVSSPTLKPLDQKDDDASEQVASDAAMRSPPAPPKAASPPLPPDYSEATTTTTTTTTTTISLKHASHTSSSKTTTGVLTTSPLPPPISMPVVGRPSPVPGLSSTLTRLSTLSSMPAASGLSFLAPLSSLTKNSPFLKGATIGRNKGQPKSTGQGQQQQPKTSFLNDLEEADAAKLAAMLPGSGADGSEDAKDSAQKDKKKAVLPRRIAGLAAAADEDASSDDDDDVDSSDESDSSSDEENRAGEDGDSYDKSVRKTAAKLVRVAGSKRKADDDGDEYDDMEAQEQDYISDLRTTASKPAGRRGYKPNNSLQASAWHHNSTTNSITSINVHKESGRSPAARGTGRKLGGAKGRGKKGLEDMF